MRYDLYLLVPKLRKGGSIPFFVTERKRSEQALLKGGSGSLHQWRFHSKDGTSRPKLRDSNPSLPVKSCEITKDLNDQVEWFRTHPLEKEYPVIWVDALYEKVRCEKHVISMAIAVVQGITNEGNREILAVEPLIA